MRRSIFLLLSLALTTPRAFAEDLSLAPDCASQPLSPAQRDVLWNTAEDDPPELLLGARKALYGTHYYVSDEEHPELFLPHLKNIGGGYIGIGSDQGYLFIGWQRPAVAWLIDYDEHIVTLHLIHQAFFLEADSPQAFLDLWASEARAREVLASRLGDFHDQKFLHKILRKGQRRVPKRLSSLRKTLDDAGVPSYLNDQASYDHVRRMIANGCVRPMLANLLDANGLRGIAESARTLNTPIRLLYLSNAEEYWPYRDNFRENILALPFDDASTVLRTIASSRNVDYRYHVQPALKYAAWLRADWLVNVYQMTEKLKVEGRHHYPFSVIDYGPEEGHKLWKARRREYKRKKKARAERDKK